MVRTDMPASRKLRIASLILLTTALLSLTVMVGTSYGEVAEGKLSPNEWSCGHCGASEWVFEVAAETVTEGSRKICVTPATYNGKWEFPYGWDCSATGYERAYFSDPSGGQWTNGVKNTSSVTYRYRMESMNG